PASATAVCKNGTFSSSQNRSGTCSSNGGGLYWTCPGVLCNGVMTTDVPISFSFSDIESLLANAIGQIELYKVDHHGSRFSSNTTWLSVTTPKVGIISVGSGHSSGHPTADALTRLHTAGTKTYWTSVGNGAAPTPGLDVVAGNVVVEVARNATTFT